MKRNLKPLVAALTLMASLLGVGLAAQAQQLPIALRQDLTSPVGHVEVLGLHDVSVILDTADYLQVVTFGTADQVDSLRQPLDVIKLSGGTLAVPADFPYTSGINIHTTARRLHLEAKDDAQLWLLSASGRTDDTLRLEYLWLDAAGRAIIQSPRVVVADQAVLDADDFATLRLATVESRDITRKMRAESRLQLLNSTEGDEPYQPFSLFQSRKIFYGISIGVGGWSDAPFGGMSAPMGDYAMNATLGFFDVRYGWNFLRRRHWDFGLGLAVTSGGYIFPRLMGVSTDDATGLSHFGPVAEPEEYRKPRYDGQGRVWNSRLLSGFISVPLRVEWHRRLDYRGLRLGVELRPGIDHTRFMRSQCTWTSGAEAEAGRSDLLTDTLSNAFNRLRCDLRFDIGCGHFSFFVQGALTPLFRTARKDDDTPQFDTRVYPLTIGFSFNY